MKNISNRMCTQLIYHYNKSHMPNHYGPSVINILCKNEYKLNIVSMLLFYTVHENHIN
jgi:hypothetical protein